MKFYQGDTVEVVITNKTAAGALADVGTSMTITITDSEGTEQVPATDMTAGKTSTGTYSYFFDITTAMPVGVWTILITVVDTAHNINEESSFEVIAL
jgi:uncharacterized protein YfaS (alpha-2-macroglobulin family)